MKRSWIKRWRKTPRRSERERDVDYMMWVKRQLCCARTIPGHHCAGPIEADHAGWRPLGRKASDNTCIPLCQLGHRQRTDFSGPFRDWNKAQMREWLDTAIALMRYRYHLHTQPKEH